MPPTASAPSTADPREKGVVLTTDGTLKIIDPATASVTEEYPVIDAWEEPVEWQKARPTLFVQDEVAYVSDPAEQVIHIVDLDDGEVMASEKLPMRRTNSPASLAESDLGLSRPRAESPSAGVGPRRVTSSRGDRTHGGQD